MRIVIINIIIFSSLIFFSELIIRVFKISQLQGVEQSLFDVSGDIVLNQSNTEAVIFGKKAYIDSNGFRVPSKDYVYKYDTSLLVLGDSVSFGVGVEESKTFVGILRNQIKTNIYNASVAGHNLIDYASLMKNYHSNLKDISRVAIFIGLNDVHFSKGVIKKNELNENNSKESFYINFLKNINIYLRNKSALFVFLKSKFMKSDEKHFNLLNSYYNDQDILIKFKKTLFEMDNFAKSKKLKVTYVILPYSYQTKNNCNKNILFPQNKIKNIFSELKISVYDFTKEFCLESKKRLFLNYDPVHLSEDGHFFVNNLLINKIYNN